MMYVPFTPRIEVLECLDVTCVFNKKRKLMKVHGAPSWNAASFYIICLENYFIIYNFSRHVFSVLAMVMVYPSGLSVCVQLKFFFISVILILRFL